MANGLAWAFMRMIAFRVAGRGACRLAGRWAGRDDRLMAGRCSPCCSFACRSFVFSYRLAGRLACRGSRRFCQLVLAACQAVEVSWMDVSAGGVPWAWW